MKKILWFSRHQLSKEQIQDLKDRQQNYKDYMQTLEAKNKHLSFLQEQLKQIQKEINDTTLEINNLKANPLEQIQESLISDKLNELNNIEHLNKRIRDKKELLLVKNELNKAKLKSDELTCKIESINKYKKDKIQNAHFPIQGLSFDDESVLFENKPISQLSTGEQIRISTAIAMALNPKLKVILIREGSLLDKEALKSIQELAKDKDYQIWIEKVSDDKAMGIYIENGQII